MISFLGAYESTVDAKGRFLLPAGFRKQLPQDASARFVINLGFENCLTLYPLHIWTPIADSINELSDYIEKERVLKRTLLSDAIYIDLDSAGRLLLPKTHIQHASIDKDIVLSSMGNKLEIWDVKKRRQFFDSFDANAFSALANEVMSKKQASGKDSV